MAKTAYAIRMDFQNANRQAEKLEDIAKKIEQTAKNDLMGCMQGVSNNWKSDSATTYCRKGREVANQLQSLATSLQKTATSVRTIARNTYDAEMRALELAKKRRY